MYNGDTSTLERQKKSWEKREEQLSLKIPFKLINYYKNLPKLIENKKIHLKIRTYDWWRDKKFTVKGNKVR